MRKRESVDYRRLRLEKKSEVIDAVDELFRDFNSPFHAVNSPQNRADFVDAVLKCSWYGQLRVEYLPTQDEIDLWLDEFRDAETGMGKKRESEEGSGFSDWVKDYLNESNPDVLYEPLPGFAADLRDVVLKGGNSDLKSVFAGLDHSGIADLAINYGIVHIKPDILEKQYKVALLFATPEEIKNGMASIKDSLLCLEEDGVATEYLESPEKRALLAGTAFNALLASQNRTFSEIVDYGDHESDVPDEEESGHSVEMRDRNQNDNGSFLLEARQEIEGMGRDSSYVLAILSLAYADQLHELLDHSSIKIEPGATAGLFDMQNEAPGPLGIRLKESVSLPKAWLHDIIIAPVHGNPQQLIEKVGSNLRWNNTVSPCDDAGVATPVEMEGFVDLVRRRMEERQEQDLSPSM